MLSSRNYGLSFVGTLKKRGRLTIGTLRKSYFREGTGERVGHIHDLVWIYECWVLAFSVRTGFLRRSARRIMLGVCMAGRRALLHADPSPGVHYICPRFKEVCLHGT